MARKRTSPTRRLWLSSTVKHSLLVLCVALLSACDLVPRPSAPSSADYCDIDLTAPVNVNDTLIEVWASAPRQHCLRLFAPLLAALDVPGVSVFPVEKNINSYPYGNLLTDAVNNGRAPDIAFVYEKKIRELAKSGALYPLKQCGFTTEDWLSEIYQISEWSLPFEADVQVLFYSKIILRQLGWTEQQILAFPETTASGALTLNDLFAIAQQAYHLNLVAKGFAFTFHEHRFPGIAHLYQLFDGSYARTNLLVINRKSMLKALQTIDQALTLNLTHRAFSQREYSNIINRLSVRDALANGRILFAHTAASEWKRMLLDQVTDEAQLNHNIGMALVPNVERNRPGTAVIRSLGSYVIFNEAATGRNNQVASCRLLSALQDSTLDRAHATRTSQISPTHNRVWRPPSVPNINVDNLFASYLARTTQDVYVNQINNAVALLAQKRLTVEQAAVMASRPPIDTALP